MLKKEVIVSILVITTLSIIGCGIKSPDAYYGVADVYVSIESQSRTILYDFAGHEVVTLRFDYINGPIALESEEYSVDNQISLNLFYGDWTVDIYGLDSSDNEIVYSQIIFTVTPSEITSVNAELKSLTTDVVEPDASGSVSVTLDWSAVDSNIKSEIKDVNVEFGPVGELSDVSTEVTVNNGDDTAVFSRNPCASGNFVLNFSLLNSDDVVIAVATEAVNVRDYLASTGIISLSSNDFNLSGLDITITIDLPEDEVITFDYSNDHVFTSAEISSGVTVLITNSEAYDSYYWSLYGYTLSSTTNTVNLPTDLSIGIHHLTVYVEKDGDIFSETLRFIVEG